MDEGPRLTSEQRRIIKRQGTRYLRRVGSLVAGLGAVNVSEAITYLKTCVSPLRDEIRRCKSLFGRDCWLILKEEQILARLAQEVFIREEFAYHFPEVREWLWDNGYDETGVRRKTVLNFVLPQDMEN